MYTQDTYASLFMRCWWGSMNIDHGHLRKTWGEKKGYLPHMMVGLVDVERLEAAL